MMYMVETGPVGFAGNAVWWIDFHMWLIMMTEWINISLKVYTVMSYMQKALMELCTSDLSSVVNFFVSSLPGLCIIPAQFNIATMCPRLKSSVCHLQWVALVHDSFA